jgi:hypothetical protein
MKLDFVFLADAGFALKDTGLFSVINGGINIVRCETFPGSVHSLVLLGRISFDPAECGKTQRIDINIQGPGGIELAPAFQNVEYVPPVNPLGEDRPSALTLCFTFQSVQFPAPGVYFFQVSHRDNGLLGKTSLEVVAI